MEMYVYEWVLQSIFLYNEKKKLYFFQKIET